MLTNFTTDLVSKVFPATPVSHVAANLPLLVEALNACQCDRTMAIMALATIRAETESFLPINEFPSHWNTSPGGVPFDRYDYRSDLGNQGPPDGARFRGRGYVQLTGRANYDRIGKLLNVDLINNPDAANDPETAAAILVRFLLLNENQLRTALQRQDLTTARKLVNGGSNGLDRFKDAFLKADAILR